MARAALRLIEGMEKSEDCQVKKLFARTFVPDTWFDAV
jgi:hypothetical protein